MWQFGSYLFPLVDLSLTLKMTVVYVILNEVKDLVTVKRKNKKTPAEIFC